MIQPRLIASFIVTIVCCSTAIGQRDSTLYALQQVPGKYISTIDKKIDQYTAHTSSRTTKTLTRLSKWENKIKNTLQKVNPEAANRLFGNSQLTFAGLLQKIQQGEATGLGYYNQYDKYRDELTTNIKYLDNQREYLDGTVEKKMHAAKEKVKRLNEAADSAGAVEQFIKERKKQLIDGTISILGKNKYLGKMNKEVYYYSETLRNYKEVFSDSKKAEETTTALLQNIPAFNNFFRQNSMLASLFGNGRSAGAAPSLEGLQTRSEVSSMLQTQVLSGGANAQIVVQENIKAAKEQLNTIKNKMASLGAGGADVDDRLGAFKPNNQRTKTFLQRIETGFNFQSQGANSYFPTTTDIALTAAYKLNDKASIGIGSSYKLGWGSSITNIQLTTQGVGLRSFAEYKIKGSFYAGGGFEYNYQPPAVALYGTAKTQAWQQSGLAGISKIISAKSKFYKKTKVQLFWDFLSYSQLPRTAPVKFRIGYVL